MLNFEAKSLAIQINMRLSCNMLHRAPKLLQLASSYNFGHFSLLK